MEVSCHLHNPVPLLRGKSHGTHLTGDWLGPTAGADALLFSTLIALAV